MFHKNLCITEKEIFDDLQSCYFLFLTVLAGMIGIGFAMLFEVCTCCLKSKYPVLF